ncbi:MAG: iron-sulfur cluster assembly accessory protein [Candidatus Eisenbacteria bacterium]
MIIFTDAARERVLAVMEAQGKTDHGIRVRIAGRGSSGYRHELSFVEPGTEREEDGVVEIEGFKVYVDTQSAALVKDTKVDYVEDAAGGGFVFDNPNEVTFSDPDKGKAVQDLVESSINPALANHGGFVELLDVKDGNVFVRLGGGCQGCGMVDVTLKQGIERIIKEKVEGIDAVIDTTDHAGGNNPYYQPSHHHG